MKLTISLSFSPAAPFNFLCWPEQASNEMFTLALQLHPLSNNTLSNVKISIPLPAGCEPTFDDEQARVHVNERDMVWMIDHVSNLLLKSFYLSLGLFFYLSYSYKL